MEMQTRDFTVETLPEAGPEANPERWYQCRTCKRAFTRADHLTRHVRAHTKQKPYICSICTKGFARVDLLKRHVTGHSNSSRRQRRDTVRASRVIQACEACSLMHLRCEDEKPCSRCRKKNIDCRVADTIGMDEVGDETAETAVTASDALNAAQDLLDFSHSTTPRQIELDRSLEPGGSNEAEANLIEIQTQETPQPENDGQSSMALGTADDNMMPFIESGIGTSPDGFLPDFLRSMPPLDSYFSGHAATRGIMDLSFNWDVDLNDLDMGFLDQYNMQIPFNPETPSTDQHSVEQQPPVTASSPHDDVAGRAEAFRKSVWRYLPRSNRDFGAAEQPNLALSDSEKGSSQHRSKLISRRVIEERLSQVTRDKLLALVLSTCSPSNINRIASAFPGIELLDSLVQYFLTSPSLDSKSWFHLATFSPQTPRTGLLANIIASGAVSTPDVPLRKLGFALQEAARTSQAREFEEDNTAIRGLQHIQTLLLSLEIGMWSGISRKMEISESFLQPLLTMLRRGGRFKRSTWSDIEPSPEDTGRVLKEKWNQWVMQESYLRLVYRAFRHDRQSSMALLKPPLVSYSEMQLPLPSSDPLWLAGSAEIWKTKYLSSSLNSKRPSPTDCLLDLRNLNQHDSASINFLYMVWGMIWEYRQMASLAGRTHVQPNNSLILSSRHQELTKYLSDFEVSSPTVAGSLSAFEERMTMQLMRLHLNAPLDDMQLFAGIEGQEEARRAYSILKDWAVTAAARQSLLHAGQILQIAKLLPSGQLCNFHSVAVYHAGLILWGFGVIHSVASNNDGFSEKSNPICVDEDNIEVRRFVTLGEGKPAIHGSQEHPVELSNTNRLMETLIQLLRANHEPLPGSCPPLAENLVQLMEGLRSATG